MRSGNAPVCTSAAPMAGSHARLWEILDNAVDEALGGWCSRIEVHLLPDGSVEIRDDGRGIPVDKEPKTRLTGVEVVFASSTPEASSGRLLHGLGRAARGRCVGGQRVE